MTSQGQPAWQGGGGVKSQAPDWVWWPCHRKAVQVGRDLTSLGLSFHIAKMMLQ